jgi:hypothetical protein
MNPNVRVIAFVLALSVRTFADESGKKAPTSAEQFKALVKEFNAAAYALHQAKTDD